MTERNDPGQADGDGVRLTRQVLGGLPPLSREDEATAAVVSGMLEAAQLLKEDDIGSAPS
jgi:hypothetical protein